MISSLAWFLAHLLTAAGGPPITAVGWQALEPGPGQLEVARNGPLLVKAWLSGNPDGGEGPLDAMAFVTATVRLGTATVPGVIRYDVGTDNLVWTPEKLLDVTSKLDVEVVFDNEALARAWDEPDARDATVVAFEVEVVDAMVAEPEPPALSLGAVTELERTKLICCPSDQQICVGDSCGECRNQRRYLPEAEVHLVDPIRFDWMTPIVYTAWLVAPDGARLDELDIREIYYARPTWKADQYCAVVEARSLRDDTTAESEICFSSADVSQPIERPRPEAELDPSMCHAGPDDGCSAGGRAPGSLLAWLLGSLWLARRRLMGLIQHGA